MKANYIDSRMRQYTLSYNRLCIQEILTQNSADFTKGPVTKYLKLEGHQSHWQQVNSEIVP